jgi:heme/copper-type cytochrome/quinol oxidase subunit 3
MSSQQAAAPHGAVGQEHTSTGLDNVKMGMWAFLGSECLFFGSLISTYLLYRHTVLPDQGPNPHDIYDIPYTSVSSFVLLMSSLTMVLALAAIQRGDHKGLRVWILATAMLGIVFVGGQIYEFTVFVEEGLKLSSSLPGFTARTSRLGYSCSCSSSVCRWRAGYSRRTREKSSWSGSTGTSWTSYGSSSSQSST